MKDNTNAIIAVMLMRAAAGYYIMLVSSKAQWWPLKLKAFWLLDVQR